MSTGGDPSLHEGGVWARIAIMKWMGAFGRRSPVPSVASGRPWRVPTDTTRLAALACALPAIVLAGCSADASHASPTLGPLRSSAPTSSPATPTSPGASTSPALVIKAGPPPKTPFTRDGAEQFVRAYYLTATQALLTAKTDDLRRYTRAGCECRHQIALIDQVASKGEHFIGRGYQLRQLHVQSPLGNATVARVTFALRAMPLVDARGRKVDQLTDVAQQTDELFLRYLNQRWYVERVFFGRPT